MRKIIAFTGVKQSGKSTAFLVAKKHFGDVTEIMLARRLKEVCAKVFKLDFKHMEDGVLKETLFEDPVYLDHFQIMEVIEAFGYSYNFDKNIRPFMGKILETPRQILQYVGTEVLHKIDKDIHIKASVENLPEDGVVIITDMRFEREFNYFKEKYPKEFLPFYIHNSRAEMIAEQDQHKSEKDIQNFKNYCTMIDNNFSLLDYEVILKKTFKDII